MPKNVSLTPKCVCVCVCVFVCVYVWGLRLPGVNKSIKGNRFLGDFSLLTLSPVCFIVVFNDFSYCEYGTQRLCPIVTASALAIKT